MSDSYEPTAKKSKVASESDTVMKNRLILAGKKLFSVNSEALASKSEYFRILFHSDFKEKEQKIIELKEIRAKSFEQFLLVIERPEDFKATKGKLFDLIATLAYFNYTDPLKTIMKNKLNFDKIPRKELFELARTFVVPDIKEIVEDWYLVRFQVSHQALKYQQLQYAVEYGMNRLENRLLDYFAHGSFFLDEYMDKIVNDDSELGRKVYQKIKARVLELANINGTSILDNFTSKMNEAQFEDVTDDVETLLLAKAQRKTPHELVLGFSGHIKFYHVRKMGKLKAYVTERFIKDFPSSRRQFDIISYADEFSYDELMAFAVNYLITDFPQSHDWNTIHLAIHYDLDQL